jgi:biotin carboxylase
MEKIVILGANDSINKLILKAKENNFETHVFSWDENEVGSLSADNFYKISIDDKNSILEKCREIQPVGVVSITTDFAVETINFITKKLGLNGNSNLTSILSRNKFKMREAFAQVGLPTPWFISVGSYEEIQLKGIRYPVIVKPTDRWSSKGVSLVKTEDDLENAVNYAINLSNEKRAIIESYIKGREYSAECISFHGDHKILAITKKYTSGNPHFVETAHMEPTLFDNLDIDTIYKDIEKALDALMIENGASHVEFKIDSDKNLKIIEIGSRMGGDLIGTDLVQISTGYDYIKMVLDVSVNKAPQFVKICQPRIAIAKFILCEEDINVFEIIKMKYPHYVSEYSKVIRTENIVDSSTRWGHYLLRIDINDKDAISEIVDLCNLRSEVDEEDIHFWDK